MPNHPTIEGFEAELSSDPASQGAGAAVDGVAKQLYKRAHGNICAIEDHTMPVFCWHACANARPPIRSELLVVG